MGDPRLYQIGTLASLLVYGMGWLDFDITPGRVVLLLTTVLATQWVGDRLEPFSRRWRNRVPPSQEPDTSEQPRRFARVRTALVGGPPFRLSARSALISGLSLCLLLRTNRSDLAILAAILTIGAKFLIRVDGKHVFNPTNGGIIAMLLLTNQVWVSPGQWGSAAFFAFLLACAGSLVVNRAARSDVTYAFIACYCALLVGRSLYLGEPLTIPLHRLQSGALVLFTFFMISDPKTTPDSRLGRVLFAALVASGAWYVQFRLFRTNGLLWSLAGCSTLVPLINRIAPGLRYVWPSALSTSTSSPVLPRFDVVRTFRSAYLAGLKACTTYRLTRSLS